MVTGEPMRTSMARRRMLTDPKLLTLAQWLSPSYPVGAFSWSHGLEQAAARGWVRDRETLFQWLKDVLSAGSGRTDAILIGLAHRAEDADALADVDALARAFSPAAERLREAERQGAAFAAVTREVWRLDLPAHLLPVSLGRAARLMEMPVCAVAALHLHAFAGNLVSAAQRLIRLGQTEAQRALARLAPLCLDISKVARDAEPEDLASRGFLSDIAAMNHETQQPRLFQS